MTQLSPEDLQDFSSSVDGVLGTMWPSALDAGADDAFDTLGRVWAAAADQGWTDLAADRALDAVVAATTRLGRVACPLPLMDLYVAGRLLKDDAAMSAGIVDGTVRPVVASVAADGRSLRALEAGPVATHVVLLTDAGEVVVREVVSAAPTDGLARPPWSDVELAERETQRLSPGRGTVDDFRSLITLGLVARAVAAAERTVEHSITYAGERVAFGKQIGSFQAVSHRAVNGATDIRAAHALIREAVQTHLSGQDDWRLATSLAVEFGRSAAINAQFGAAHTLAAMGYFDEHEAPWLFRRVNADASAIDAIDTELGEVADILIEQDRSLPRLGLGERAERFREEIQEFLATYQTNQPVAHLDAQPDERFLAEAVERGYVTFTWPKKFGGREASVEEQVVMAEELSYQRLPLRAKGIADTLGTPITRQATPEQQQRFLPLLASGKFPFYLGYSEPEVGSDLVNLRTRAVRDGDDWIVNGRKMWGTMADRAEWVWLATRTDPDAKPPHAGITVFLTRVDRPGFELQKHTALSGEISCSTFFDDYRIPDEDRIGEVNGGWKVITEALAIERVSMANTAAMVHRLLDDMLGEIRKAGTAGERGSAKRRAISELAARLQAARVLVVASVRATADTGGSGARLEAPMAKIIATQLLEDFSEAALRIFGPVATLAEGVADVPGRGAFEYYLRLSIMQVVGGGTIDIQRNLVARALGLPR
jgi:alkylation response protein AidB-like acyl-CoA dehydrogenase